jgi:hypothetical protein
VADPVAEDTAATTDVEPEAAPQVVRPAENVLDLESAAATEIVAETSIAPPATPAAQLETSVPTPASPVRRAAFGERAPNVPVGAATKPAASFSEFLAALAQEKEQEGARVAAAAAAGTAKKKVAFDKETMRRTAPRSAPAPTAPASTLSRKQKQLVASGHVSQGRRGPVAPKGSKGSIAQMQNQKYLEMAAAFERLLTNAATINAHLDTR